MAGWLELGGEWLTEPVEKLSIAQIVGRVLVKVVLSLLGLTFQKLTRWNEDQIASTAT